MLKSRKSTRKGKYERPEIDCRIENGSLTFYIHNLTSVKLADIHKKYK